MIWIDIETAIRIKVEMQMMQEELEEIRDSANRLLGTLENTIPRWSERIDNQK